MKGTGEQNFSQIFRREQMGTCLTFCFFIFLATGVPALSSPDHFINSLPHHREKPQQYFELSHPLPSDHLNPSCTVNVIHHSFADTINSPPFSAPYSPPTACPLPWSHVVLDFRASSFGEQYDRISAVWLDGVELFRTSTAEPTETGIFWSVRKDITRYYTLLAKPSLITMMLENVVNDIYTGVYNVDVSFLYYRDIIVDAVKIPSIISNWQELSLGLYESPADLIIPICDDGDRGFWLRIESESDVHVKKVRIPRNTKRIVMELYVSFHGDDEFWYSNPPYSYLRMNNLTMARGNGAYREVFVMIDGKFAGSEVVFPVIFTGGINPLFWEPVVGIGAFNLPSYNIDLTPFLGSLSDGEEHEFGIGVDDGISYWLVDANLHIWVDCCSAIVEAKSVIYDSPALDIVRQEFFKLLDGWFQIKARRKCRFIGWVKSDSGNITTIVSQEFKFSSMIKFERNGTYKTVNQKVKAKRETQVRGETGSSISRLVERRRFPIKVITATLPGKKTETELRVTNVTHGLNEETLINGNSTRRIHNGQDSGGWMEVEDHSVLAGEATTKQKLNYRDVYGCYSRSVLVENGRLARDNSSFPCGMPPPRSIV